MDYMAMTRFGCIEWNTNAIRWIGQTTWPLEGLYGTPMQFNGLEGLRGHGKVYMDYMAHKCNGIDLIRIHVHLQDSMAHPCN